MSFTHTLSVMQPYIFPYIGYFHLIAASSKIVFYDDVNYIKSGWINRNRILLEGRDFMFTIPVKDASSFRSIKETVPIINSKTKKKLMKQLDSAYSKAPFYKDVRPIVYSILNSDVDNIADLAINSIQSVYNYLGKELNYTKSSICSPLTVKMNKSDRLIHITKKLGYNKYINQIAGKRLYDKDYFFERGVELSFVKSNEIVYNQFKNEYIPLLSIIDILMFNDVKSVNEMITSYKIE